MENVQLQDCFIARSDEYCTLARHVNAPYLRKTFTVPDDFGRAELYVCGLGFYEFYLNGEKKSRGKLAPYICNPDRVVYVDAYDLTDALKKGENCIGFLLGNGFLNYVGGGPWDFDKTSYRSAPKLAVRLLIDGAEFLRSDESFRTCDAPILFDDIRMGEYYDARLEQKGWTEVGFDDSGWDPAVPAAPPRGAFRENRTLPIAVEREIKPINIMRVDDGFVYDFGINTAGICRLKIDGLPGQRLTLSHGEALLEGRWLYTKNTCCPGEDFFLSQRDVYISAGGQETYEPHFTYHGFRYVFIEGPSKEQATEDLLTMLVMHADFPAVSSFSCSDPLINRLYAAALNSDKSNFFYFHTDCPQREKNGWTGDSALNSDHMLFNFDCRKSLRQWLESVRAEQREDGSLPGIVPTGGWGFEWGNGPGWERSVVVVPYQLYRFGCGREVLEENADAAIGHVRRLRAKLNDDGLLAFGLSDWLETGSVLEEIGSTPLEVTDSLIGINTCATAAVIFDILGRADARKECLELKDALMTAFRKKYVTDDLYVSCRTQTAQSMAVAFGVFTQDEAERAVKNLLILIDESDGHFRVGMHGGRYLFRVLADYGHADLALKLMTADGFPSYKYWLDRGATSLWESFNELYDGSILRKDGTRTLSLNHACWGDVVAWFYIYLLGIKPNPTGDDPNHFEISPVYVSSLDGAKGTYRRAEGEITVEWRRVGDKIDLNVSAAGQFTYTIADRPA